ncbi:MAG: SIS domain-containing protein [Spirochaetaceae bacterium]|nr:SIS domain-containing protein [Spirochaetaceae bacterium]
MDYLSELITRYPCLSVCGDDIGGAYEILETAYRMSGKVLIAGNGGSAADADHIAGELMKGFVKKRRPPARFLESLRQITDEKTADYLATRIQGGLPVINLSSHSALMTAAINDISGSIIYAQQVYAYADKNDVFIGISTSGNSENVYLAMLTAKVKGLKTIALTGSSGGKIAKLADVSVKAPETETYKVQELHLPVYHCICLMLEERFFD